MGRISWLMMRGGIVTEIPAGSRNLDTGSRHFALCLPVIFRIMADFSRGDEGSMNQQEHAQLRSQFPALAQEVNGHPLIYLDNAATTQKPQAVLDAIAHYYRADNANVHRAAHALSGRATRAFEAARETVARFINAPEQPAR